MCAQPRQYTVKERDMVMKNTELSFRVRHLEEQNTELEKYKKELVSRLIAKLYTLNSHIIGNRFYLVTLFLVEFCHIRVAYYTACY